MNNPFELEINELTTTLAQMSPSGLTGFLNDVEALQTQLRFVALLNAEWVEKKSTHQDDQKIWIGMADHLLMMQEVKDAYGSLQRWDNEGGTVTTFVRSLNETPVHIR